MNQSSLKNMVILKNLPSNIVEEAIIILKANKKVKKLQKIENNNRVENMPNQLKGNEYILKEAELLVSKYISKIEENKQEKEKKNIKIGRKCKRLKNYAYVTSFIIIIETMIILIK